MKKPSEIESIGLAFFGRVSASISHEIKNTLAIINENAGLLEDLTHLAEKGLPLSADRLQRLSNTIKRQVARADGIVQKMNRFSHTTDRTVQPVNLYETTVFVTEVCDRLISIRNVSVNVTPPATPVIVSSGLFYLEHLIWACMDFMMHAQRSGNAITLTFEKRSPGAQIKLSGSGSLETVSAGIFPSQTEKTLQESLQADIHVDAGNAEILILLPEAIH